jgi:hypothetical protein
MNPERMFYEARWWRSQCVVTEHDDPDFQNTPTTCIVPGEKLEEYNPFDFYYPAGSTAKGRRSLPYLFTDVSINDPQELAEFCSRFGIVRPHSDLVEYSWLKWAEDNAEKHDLHFEYGRGLSVQNVDSSIVKAMPLYEIRDEWYKLWNFVVTAKTAKREMAFEDLYCCYDGGNMAGWNVPMPTDFLHARNLVKEMLAVGCSELRPRLEWNDVAKRWIWTWDTLSLMGLMYLMIGFDLQGPGFIRACTGCNHFFLADRENKAYCEPECQNRAKVKRHYDRTVRQEKS